MAQHSSRFLAPPTHGLSTLTHRTQRPLLHVRSRSVPDIREEPWQMNNDTTHQGPAIYVEDNELSGYGNPVQTEDMAEDVNLRQGGMAEVGQLSGQPEASPLKLHGNKVVHSGEESQFTLSYRGSRRRVDSDNRSQTETIVPRRNLTVLDV